MGPNPHIPISYTQTPTPLPIHIPTHLPAYSHTYTLHTHFNLNEKPALHSGGAAQPPRYEQGIAIARSNSNSATAMCECVCVLARSRGATSTSAHTHSSRTSPAKFGSASRANLCHGAFSVCNRVVACFIANRHPQP